MGFRLDWVNVQYRNLYIAGAAIALLGILLATAFGLRESIADLLSGARKEARVEIQAAERLVGEASVYARDPKTSQLRDTSAVKLEEARTQYGRRDYQDARTSAIVAQNYAQKVIDMGRGESETSREVRFYKIEGEVRVKRAGQFHWEDATSRMLLRIGDQIKTGAHSGAQIIYFDGTTTTVRPESLLEIKDLYEEPTTRERRVKEKLNWGEVETSTRKANVAGSFHEVQSESASARTSEESEFKVAYDRADESGSISLSAGRVDVATERAKVTVKAGERVTVDKGVLGAVEKLPPAPRPLVPADQKIFVYATPQSSATTLAWEKVPGAEQYRLQLSDRSLFSDLLLDKADVRTSTVELPGLPPAAYFWRVSAQDAEGRSSPYSPGRKFRITTTEVRDRRDKTPPVLAVQDFIQNGPYVIVNGKTEPDATLWVEGERMDVDESGGFYAVVRLKREGLNQVRIVAQDAAGNETRKSLEAYLEGY